MKQLMYGSLLCLATHCYAAESTVPEKPQSLCSREILLTFFPKSIVVPILIKHKIPATEADKIADNLAKKDGEILSLVEEKAIGAFTGHKSPSESDSNIHEGLRDKGVRIFKESLSAVFSKTIAESGVKIEPGQIQVILDEIQETKGELFLKCIHSKFSFPTEKG